MGRGSEGKGTRREGDGSRELSKWEFEGKDVHGRIMDIINQ